MKLALAILALIVFGLSLLADYKWRQWMKKRHPQLQIPKTPIPPNPPHSDPTRPNL
jgi:hypothetical protein